MTSEDDFQRALDAQPDDWQTRLVFADWLDERGDPRAAGYRAIATQRRHPVLCDNRDRGAIWWANTTVSAIDRSHNVVPSDWFALLPADVGNKLFWPQMTKTVLKSRRECEDALALAFAQLPLERQTELLNAPRRAGRRRG